MSVDLTKTDPTCSNIYLIDENQCVGASLETLNGNIKTLSSTLCSFSQNLQHWQDVSNLFFTSSATVIATALTIDSIKNSYFEPYTTVSKNSATWNKEFSLYYPQINLITFWYNLGDTTINNILTGWLGSNGFSNNEVLVEQKINIYVSLYGGIPFTFVFSRSYVENCNPNSGGTTVTCSGCGSDPRYHGCNITGIGCRNAYSYCTSSQTKASNTYACGAKTGQTTLMIDYETGGTDRLTSRVTKYSYINTLSAGTNFLYWRRSEF